MDARLLNLLTFHHGAVRLCELQRAGISKWEAWHQVQLGVLTHAERGVFALPNTPEWWSAARSRGADVSCVTLAAALGLWTFNPSGAVHISHSGSCPDIPAVPHRRRGTGYLALIKQCCECLDELGALLVMESALVLGRISYDQLRKARQSASAKYRAVFALVVTGSQSMFETVARYHLVKAGYLVQVQKQVRGAGHIDLYVDGILGIELDSREHHSSDQAFAEDRRRDNEYTYAGISKIRVTYAQVVHHPNEFLANVQRALAAHTAPAS